MWTIAVQMFSSSPFPIFFSFYKFICVALFLALWRAKEKHYYAGVGSGESTRWSSGSFLALCSIVIPLAYNPIHSWNSSSFVFHQNIWAITLTLRKTFPISRSILLCITAELVSVATVELSCFLSREWQIAPSGSLSLWSPLRVAATVIPCTTFKHIPFALQFVQPGIITTPLSPPPPPHIAASLWVSPIPGLFCPLQGSILCFSCPVCFHSAKAWIVSDLTATPLAKLYT